MKVKLGDVCEINMGQSPASTTYNEEKIGIPFFQGNVDFGEIFPTVRIWCSEPKKISHYGDILISVRAPIGALNFSNCDCCIGRGLAALTVDKEVCLQKYLWYVLINKIEELNSKGTGSTFKAINKSILSETEFNLPDLVEQRHIAAVLDKVSDLIALRKKQLAKLDELVKARFVEMFGDPVLNTKKMDIVYLLDIAEYYNGLTYKPENIKDNGVIILRSSNIKNNHLNFDDIVRVDCNIKARLFVRENDILMCSRNGSSRLVGKVALVDNLFEPMGFGAFMMIVRSSYYSYLLIYFQLEAFRRQIRTGATTTINQITGAMLDKVMLPIPDQDSLESFNIFYKKIKKYEYIIKNSLSKMETLKKSLMQEYFG